MATDKKLIVYTYTNNDYHGSSSGLVFLYTFFAIFSTLFELYGISYTYNTFTWRFASVLLFSFLALINTCYKGVSLCKENSPFIPFLFVVGISFCVNGFLGTSGYELRLLRFLFFFFFAVFLSPRFFNATLAMKLYRVVVWVATIVMYIQVIFANFFGVFISGHLDLPLRSPTYAAGIHLSRFYSIFEEPGYYGLFVATYLCVKLAEHKINFVELFFICLALLVSTSTSNIGIMAFILFYYVFVINDSSMNFLKKIIAKILVLSIGAASCYFFMASEQFVYVSKRLDEGTSASSRMSGYMDLASYFDGSVLKVLFGNGMESYPISGYSTLFIVFGIVGAVAYLFGLFNLFRRTNFIGRFILFTFLFINVGNVEFLGNASSMLIIFPFVIWYCSHNSYESGIQNEKYSP